MRVLLDTNVVMDFLVERDGFDALSLRWKDIEILKPSTFIEKYISENEDE